MSIRSTLATTAPLLLVACGGTGTWEVSTYGEPYIEEEIPAADFADGCNATFDTFQILVTQAALVDGDGTVVAEMPDAQVFDVAKAGPHAVVSLEAPATFYDTARFQIAPSTTAVGGNVEDSEAQALADSGDAMWATGSLTCGGETAQFDWRFDTQSIYDCALEDLVIPNGGTDGTELTVHGDHFFYDGLENEDAEVRGQAVIDADADDDGMITQAELAAVPIAPLGYQVGSNSDVTDLGAFIRHLTGSLGHVDGEGHCDVTR
jgi:hypothetical protein